MNHRWHSQKHCYTYASGFTCILIKTKEVKQKEEEENKSKEEHKKYYLLLLAETMEERRRIHRCHSQHKPLSLTYMNLHLT